MKKLGLLFFLLVNAAAYGRAPVTNVIQARITLVMPDTATDAPAYLSLYRNALYKQTPDSLYTARGKHNSYTFVLNLPARYCYFSIHRQTNSKGTPIYLFEDYLVQQNDSVTITLKPAVTKEENNTQIVFAYYAPIRQLHKYKVAFSGRGAPTYTCRYEADDLLQQTPGSLLSIDTTGVFSRYEHADTALTIVRRYMMAYKDQLAPDIYTQMLTDIVAMLECERLYFFQLPASVWHHHARFYQNAQRSYQAIYTTKEKYCGNSRQKTISPWYSRWKAMYYSQVYNNRYDTNTYQPPLLTHTVQQIRQQYKGLLADQIIAFYVPASPRITQSAAIQAITAQMQDEYCLQLVNSFLQTSAGFPAKDFQLEDAYGNRVSLHQFRGKIVFIDFWFIGCSACNKYYKEILGPIEEKYRTDSTVVFISINVDKRADWLKEIDSGNYTSSRCINLNTGEKGLTHPVIKDYDVTVYPRPYLMSKKGTIITSKNSDLRFGGINRLITFIEKAKTWQQ